MGRCYGPLTGSSESQAEAYIVHLGVGEDEEYGKFVDLWRDDGLPWVVKLCRFWFGEILGLGKGLRVQVPVLWD